jgi:tRNA nucleotidyltransferase (CCA-adding enzyme)
MVNRLPHEKEILARHLRPTKKERDLIRGVAQDILGAIREIGNVEGMVVGSVARNTWVKGDRDLDVFLLFDPAMSRENLEMEGLARARAIASRFTDQFHEKYAEHPYINACIRSVDVDLVPCYKVDNPASIQSAVDRTPFHTRYIAEKINGLIDDVLLLKRFAKAGGVYGSDQMTEGFSGYLCELLVLYYGGFSQLVLAAAAWHPHLVIDIEHHASKEFDEPLVVVDPVDPRRNVAAALSLDRMAEFIELARGYADAPSVKFFEIPDTPSITQEDLACLLEERGTSLIAVTFGTPPFIEEIIVPQLKRSVHSVTEHLERNGFVVHHAHYRMGQERCIFLFEFLVADLPKIRRHIGPPLWNRVNAEKFREKHQNQPLPGPFINDGRYETEMPRTWTSAAALLSSPALLSVSLGPHVRQSLENDWEVTAGVECWNEELAPFLATFFARCSPLTRIQKGG